MAQKSFNTEEFNKQAAAFAQEYDTERRDLEKCLSSRLNDDINFVCQSQKEKYLKGIALAFCKVEYDSAVKCQRDNEHDWASHCFQQNTLFGQCADGALRRMYIYNLEQSKKNPANVPTPK